jgi:pre-mRNA cleavage complex 2 protein Pcf11
MSAGLPSDEVADDYKNSLEDLVTNDRYQIGNLTVIARENIEHGEAIARVLENHTQRVGTRFPPSVPLPISDFQLFWQAVAPSGIPP